MQKIGFPYNVNKDLVNTLRVSLYLYYNEEEIYQLSVRREPRDMKYSTSGPVRLYFMISSIVLNCWEKQVSGLLSRPFRFFFLFLHS